MQTQWFSDLPPDQQENFKKSVEASKLVLDKLIEICYNRINNLETVTIKDYDNPSWSHKQAHRNGEIDELRKIIDLCTIKERP